MEEEGIGDEGAAGGAGHRRNIHLAGWQPNLAGRTPSVPIVGRNHAITHKDGALGDLYRQIRAVGRGDPNRSAGGQDVPDPLAGGLKSSIIDVHAIPEDLRQLGLGDPKLPGAGGRRIQPVAEMHLQHAPFEHLLVDRAEHFRLVGQALRRHIRQEIRSLGEVHRDHRINDFSHPEREVRLLGVELVGHLREQPARETITVDRDQGVRAELADFDRDVF